MKKALSGVDVQAQLKRRVQHDAKQTHKAAHKQTKPRRSYWHKLLNGRFVRALGRELATACFTASLRAVAYTIEARHWSR